MGWGDELMAAGQAARISRETGRKVAILDRHRQARVHELWEGLPFISPVKGDGIVCIMNGSGCRPYIEYPFTLEGGQRFTGWRARDNRPVLSAAVAGERDNQGFVLIEPTVKPLANQNKVWRRWQEVVDGLPLVTFVQCGPASVAGAQPLLGGRNVTFRPTAHFIDAVRVLNQAALYLGHEGGMHHAAAALDVPAVVIFGGAPSVRATGYADHTNFGGDAPCGNWLPCAHCAQTMNAITPEAVIQAVKDHLKC
jgi:hypothetical protein